MFIEQANGQTVKIKCDVNEKQLLPGDIVKIIASGKDGVLAQVSEIYTSERNSAYNIAETKILFTIENSGKLTAAQGNIPSHDFSVIRISAEELMLCTGISDTKRGVPVGILSLYPGTEVNIDAALFEHPSVIYCDRQTQKDNITNLLGCELSKHSEKTVVADFNNEYSDLKVSVLLEAGKNIKIPLDTKGLELLYEKTLSDVSPETRAMTEDIFTEIENYLSSGEVPFIPFSNFVNAVESVCKTNKTPGLVFLKNKLFKLAKAGIFADSLQEINCFDEKIRHNNLVIINLANIPDDRQTDFLEFIIDSNITTSKQKFFLIADIDKINADKAFIEKLFTKAYKSGIIPIIISGHNSDFAVDLLSYADNIIAFAPENETKISSLKQKLTGLKDNKAVIVGKITNNIPLFTNIYDTDNIQAGFNSGNSNIISEKPKEIYLSAEIPGQSDVNFVNPNPEEENFNYSNQFEHNESEIELTANISNLQEEVDVREGQVPKKEIEPEIELNVEEEEVYEEEIEPEIDLNVEEEEVYEEEIEPEIDLNVEEEEVYEEKIESEIELNVEEEEVYEEEIEPEIELNVEEEEVYEEEIEPETDLNVEDKEETAENTSEDFSFYDEYETEEIEPEDNPNSSKKYESGFSEDDLSNFIDDDDTYSPAPITEPEKPVDEDFDYDSNSEFRDESALDYTSYDSEQEPDGEDAEEYSSDGEEPSEEAEQNTVVLDGPPTPDIPVYSTSQEESDNNFDDTAFSEGEKVQHPKYGMGTVVKTIGSEEKRLVSIQFENVGRRLLDPKLAGLQKMT